MLQFIGDLFAMFAQLLGIEFYTGLSFGDVILASIVLGFVSYLLGIGIKLVNNYGRNAEKARDNARADSDQ